MARRIQVEIVGDSASLERSFRRASSSATRFNKNIQQSGGHTARTASLTRRLGSGLAFASTALIGGAGLVYGLEKSVHAAQDAQVAQALLRAQLNASGISYARNREQITQTLNKQGEMSGFVGKDLTQSFTTFVRRTGNVNQALKLNAVAVDIARGKHKDLTSVSQLLVRALAGNARAATALGLPVVSVTKNMDKLRASGHKATFEQIANAKAADKLATGQAVIASAQQKYGGQAAAFGRTSAGAQAKFQRALHETEVTIGTALLPSLTSLFQTLSQYLNRLNRTGQLQRDVKQGAHALGQGLQIVKEVVATSVPIVRGFTGALGGLRNTAKLLLGTFIAFKALNLASVFATGGGISRIGTSAEDASRRVSVLRGRLRALAALGVVAIAVEIFIHRKQIDKAVTGFLDKHGLPGGSNTIKLPKNVTAAQVGAAADRIAALKGNNDLQVRALRAAQDKLLQNQGLTGKRVETPQTRAEDLGVKVAHANALANARKLANAGVEIAKAAIPKPLTAAQRAALIQRRNQFFDSLIDRKLNRIQDLPITGQLAALGGIAAQIGARIGKTKDITRKLNLEDKLLDVQRQAKDVRQQLAQAFLDRLQFGVDKAQATTGLADDLVALNKLRDGLVKRIAADKTNLDLQRQLFQVNQQIKDARVQQRTQRQFKELGLTASGEEVTPGVKNLRKRLGNISQAVKGTFLDTDKTRATLARIRKVLSEGLVPKDVRAKLKEMLDGLSDELKNHQGKNQTLFRHANTDKILSGLGLSPAQLKAARQRLAQVGAGGTVPGAQSAAFAGAGSTTVNTTVTLDGQTVAKNTTKYQNRSKARRSASRRGPYAGRN